MLRLFSLSPDCRGCCFIDAITARSLCRRHRDQVLCDVLALLLVAQGTPFARYVAVDEAADVPAVSSRSWLRAFGEDFGIANGRLCSGRPELPPRQPAFVFSLHYEPGASAEVFFCNPRFAIATGAFYRRWCVALCRGRVERSRPLLPPPEVPLEVPSAASKLARHPRYVLHSRIPKLSALRPDARPVGELGGDPVYLRSDLLPLRSREAWMRQARVVPPGTAPARLRAYAPRVRRRAEESGMATQELFAEWQTAEYVPPAAAGGRVPRNAFGNVELFSSKMLPVGCVHVPFPAVHRVAERLGIDFAHAVTGFAFKGGHAAPRTEGIVICAEHEGRLSEAYADYCREREGQRLILEQQEQARKRRAGQRLAALVTQSAQSAFEQAAAAGKPAAESPDFEDL